MASTNFSPTRVRLATHVHACRTSDYIVLLDLKRDMYIGVSDDDTLAAFRWIDGWPPPPQPKGTGDDNVPRPRELIEALRLDGLLTADRQPDQSRVSATVPRARVALTDGIESPGTRVRPREVFLFAYAVARSRILLKFCRFERVTKYARGRRQQIGSDPLNDGIDTDTLSQLKQRVHTFTHLRPLAFSGRDACLLETLALSEFLGYYKMFPAWVFGVATAPFSAHCWLQYKDIVVNDTPDRVGKYTPIMVL